jgi:ABC-2 type transport system permease protein
MLRAAVLVALYGTSRQVAGLSLTDVVTYTGLTQAIIACLSFFGWWDVMESVYSGDVSSDLLRPMDYFSFWLARDLGRAVASLLTRGVTLILAYALVFDITVPESPGRWGTTGAALILSILTSFSWRFLVNLAAFWTPDARGVARLGYTLSWFLSGFLMPLRFFPEWFVKACHLTPFPSMVNTVVETYLGVLQGSDLLRALAGQMIWVGLLSIACHFTLRAGVRKLVVQGG